ncbi:uncharacterized protein LOC107767450 [Nicotiana tabacum]|uniref:Uncharacterized protein LOC107767450 n=1 Tax=Nicotiana tabacum TaxID=4097 RepID=A0A1S3XPS7_TOBAC|nr:uncharacterized protein LOC104098592 isoform X1 [Nicotiana tomentosiformis]XP_009603670.1 uncharacterized protein LOC104098592 isoform X2 [Nicotiana tomentosiformis]XP_009603672.1 uncharacterized protein LOC104098592 isoform X3 [Nicotiana tomentosiformis]XP_016441943.1 PREDICTED: uncharacterized protein LOC107767450 [Nicotiana tabacum]
MAGVKPINFVTSPNHTTRITKQTILTTPTWFQSKPKYLQLRATKNIGLFLVKSSAKPNANQENAADKDMLNDPSSRIQPQSTSNQPLSSSASSFSRGLVFDLGQKDSWDSTEIGSPVVKRYLSDEEERWYMWYYGRSNGKESIGLAVSSNGVHWERGEMAAKMSDDVGLVMNCGEDWWGFDTQSIRPCEVVIMSSAKVRANSSVYWLYYTGFSSEKIDFLDNSLDFSLENPERLYSDGEKGKIFKSLPGLAMSQDGRHWARIEGEHHSGALFDVGIEGEWDSLFIASPKVVFHTSGDLRMYYHSYDVEKGNFAIGIARSRDGMKWLKLGKIIGGGGKIGAFDELGVLNPHVVRNRKDGKYLMVYEGVDSNGSRSIGMAISSDGLKGWKRVQENAVLKKYEEERWDSEGVGSPYLVQMDGDDQDHEWRLYYRGIGKNGRTGIGMAVSQGNEFQSFRRWTGFHL